MVSPLSPEQQQELRTAKTSARSFLGASKVATFNGWTIGFFAFVSILSGIFDLSGLLVGLGLALVARNEFVGRRRLRALDPSGLVLLWRNQVGLMLLIIVYCAWSIYSVLANPNPELVALLELVGEGADELFKSLTTMVYKAVIGATIICQGLNARYYYVRVARIRDYLQRTPRWVLDLQRDSDIS
jgi:hypothetical protein